MLEKKQFLVGGIVEIPAKLEINDSIEEIVNKLSSPKPNPSPM